jgi:hypothetical protein
MEAVVRIERSDFSDELIELIAELAQRNEEYQKQAEAFRKNIEAINKERNEILTNPNKLISFETFFFVDGNKYKLRFIEGKPELFKYDKRNNCMITAQEITFENYKQI